MSSGEPPNSSMLNGPGLLRIAEALQDRLSLQNADLEVVEGGVVVDIAAVADQAVIGDDLDALVGSLLKHRGQRGAVDRGDHQHLGVLGDHILDLRELVRDVVFGILQVDGVALFFERRLQAVAVADPAQGGLGWHGDADQALVLGESRDGHRAQADGGGEGKNSSSGKVHVNFSLTKQTTPHRQKPAAIDDRIVAFDFWRLPMIAPLGSSAGARQCNPELRPRCRGGKWLLLWRASQMQRFVFAISFL